MCAKIIYFILFLNLFQTCRSSDYVAYNIPDPDCTGIFNLCNDADKERLGREAVKTIHEEMDDDKDGMIEASESSDFIKETLESNADSVRHRQFQDVNLQITFEDLWTQWQKSAVYNWSNDQVIDWLVNHVHLPMYVEHFRRNQIDGRMIPRLAANLRHYLSAIMHIRDPIHKRRLIIKATDVVLFGPPQYTHNRVKDICLISALVISFGACIYAFVRHRKTQETMKVMLKDLETLQKAESTLTAVTGKMKALENELKDKPKVDRATLKSWYFEIQRMKEEAEKLRKRRDTVVDNENQLRLAEKEIEQLRLALRRAEEHAQCQSFDPPNELIELLKRTYHFEELAFETKRKSAENAMLAAKEQMNRISKMQKGFFGAVRIAHTGCMDNISELIGAARQRLTSVQEEYEEREKRWNRIASILERDDLISCTSSSSTLSISSNQATMGGDLGVRSKYLSIDSNVAINTNNDSYLFTKTNSNTSTRAFTSNPIVATKNIESNAQFDMDYTNENSASSSTTVTRRIAPKVLSSADRLLTERPVYNATLVYSHSTNGLNNLLINSTDATGRNISEPTDIPLAAKQSKLAAGSIFDIESESNDLAIDDQHQQDDRKSQISDTTSDDRVSVTASETLGQRIKSKFMKKFQDTGMDKKD